MFNRFYIQRYFKVAHNFHSPAVFHEFSISAYIERMLTILLFARSYRQICATLIYIYCYIIQRLVEKAKLDCTIKILLLMNKNNLSYLYFAY